MSLSRGVASRLLGALVALAVVAVGWGAPAAAMPTGDSSIRPMTLEGFDPGNIMSDEVFTDKNTMTEAQIQEFFDSMVKKCQVLPPDRYGPIVCLKDFTTTSVDRAADTYCNGYVGEENESAARIIFKVAQSCEINPQVLIVMLQKEQGLVTHTWPSQWRYDKALGQGCPDDAPCDPRYVGFFHQIYGAARQMQIYMEGRYFTWYAAGKTWNIRYHPNAACGSSPVFIQNRTTEALYYYTPYQPNAAALRAGYGTGDSCSAYGNRNFYNYFTDWFGSAHVSYSTVFHDVSSNVRAANYSEFAAEIEWMSQTGVSTGYELEDGVLEYRPFGRVTRDAMAAFLYRAAGEPAFTAPQKSPFVDVDPSQPFYKEITWLASKGISTGWETADGAQFRPYDNITRDAMAAFLYRYAKKPALPSPAAAAFVDVPSNSEFLNEIAWLSASGISSGWKVSGGKEFRPYNAITRDAMAAFLYRFAHLE